MCLVFACNETVLLDWMQDIIFCIPATSTDAGRKIVITTVALRTPPQQQPRDLFLYYLDNIKEPVIDLTDTLLDKDHWISKLSCNLGHIKKIDAQNQSVDLPQRPGLAPEARSFTPRRLDQPATLFPQGDEPTWKLMKKAGLNSPPFTKVKLNLQAYGPVMMRFAFVMQNDPSKTTAFQSWFGFLGPEQIVQRIHARTKEYINQVWETGLGILNQDQKKAVVETIQNELNSIQFHGTNGLYNLLLGFEPSSIVQALVTTNVVDLTLPAVRCEWLQNDKNPMQASDFAVGKPGENSVLMEHFETTMSSFLITRMVYRLH